MGLNVGKFTARAMTAHLSGTKSGDVQVAVQLAFDDPRAAGVTQATWYGSFKSERSEAKTIETLRLCGWRGDDLDNLASIDGSVQVSASCEEDEYQGQKTVRVRWLNATAAKLESSKAREFAQRMKARVRAVDAAREFGPPPAAPATVEASDDIPF